MTCLTAQMPRKRRSYNIDERLINVLSQLAQKDNMSANRYLENLLFSHGQQRGVLPMDAQPLGETRGGDFTSKKIQHDRTESEPSEA